MWSYVDGTSVKPIDKKDEAKYTKELETWNVSNSNILTWINNYGSQSIGVHLAKYDTAKEVWDYLKRLYTQSNFAKQYQLESDSRSLKHNNMIIQEFYSAMIICGISWLLWNQVNWKLSKRTLIKENNNIWFNFWWCLGMILRASVGVFCIRILFSSVDSVFNELSVEKIRLKSHSNLIPNKGVLSTPPSVLLLYFTKENLKVGLRLVLMNVLFVRRKVIGKHNVPGWKQVRKFSKVHHPMLLLLLLLLLALVLIMYIHLRLHLKYLILHSSSKSFLFKGISPFMDYRLRSITPYTMWCQIICFFEYCTIYVSYDCWWHSYAIIRHWFCLHA